MKTLKGKPASTMDPVEKLANAFKVIEKKLDKLQEDVGSHGHALSELRYIVAGLSSDNNLRAKTKNLATQCGATAIATQGPKSPKSKKTGEKKKSVSATKTKVKGSSKTTGSPKRFIPRNASDGFPMATLTYPAATARKSKSPWKLKRDHLGRKIISV